MPGTGVYRHAVFRNDAVADAATAITRLHAAPNATDARPVEATSQRPVNLPVPAAPGAADMGVSTSPICPIPPIPGTCLHALAYEGWGASLHSPVWRCGEENVNPVSDFLDYGGVGWGQDPMSNISGL